MASRLQKPEFLALLQSGGVRRLFWIYAMSGVGIVIPLLLIPFLARVLGPDSWGRVLLAQSFAAILIVLVEFGFNLSGTREVAQAARDTARRRQIVGEITSAKLLCTLAAALVALLVHSATNLFRGHEMLLAMAVLWGITGGLNFGWYFLGTGRAILGYSIDTFSRLTGVIATLALVRSADDDWVAVAASAAVSILALTISGATIFAEVGRPEFSLGHGLQSLRGGAALALYVVIAGLKNSGNRMLVGLFGVPSAVAIFGNAERVTELIGRATEPAVRLAYPYMCEQTEAGRRQALRSFWRTSAFFASAVIGVCLAVALLAGPIIRLLCGPGYEASVPVLRLLAAVPVLKMGGTVLNTFWAQPHRMDRHMPAGVVLSGVVGVLLAALLIPRYGPLGMVGASVLSEVVFLGWSLGALVFSGNFPGWSESPMPPVLPELAASCASPDVADTWQSRRD